ncbi:hypothetical protein B484DRAFT_417694 [Ochromonadaceae sp. CCMP2298]|nr:hypothetical protein B484DRAFT_417694 [Ochromonadaceae sp. CCMP2298]
MVKINPTFLALVTVIAILLAYILLRGQSSNEQKCEGSSITDVAAVTLNQLSDHYTVRRSFKYTGKRKFNKLTPGALQNRYSKNKPPVVDSLFCERWAVVTTVYEPTLAVQKQAYIHGWCLVVVADEASPEDYHLESPHKNFVFLSVKKQHELAAAMPFMHALTWNHVGRKNAGYLYAILHGGKFIWDFEDDVMVMSKHHSYAVPGESDLALDDGDADSASTVPSSMRPNASLISPDALYEARMPIGHCSEVLNPYPLFDPTHTPAWPRGFPPDRILNNETSFEPQVETRPVKVAASSVGVVQYLANRDPDVDALYRLVRPIPLDFPLHAHQPLLLPSFMGGPCAASSVKSAPVGGFSGFSTTSANAFAAVSAQDQAAPAPAAEVLPVPGVEGTVYAPYNAQSTLHMYSSFWALMLPLSVNDRVSDVWRAYVAQRLFSEVGLRVSFHSPVVTHFRRPRSYLKDLFFELPLYADALALVQLLRGWRGSPSVTTLPGRLEEVYVLLAEHGFIQQADVVLLQSWLQALLEAGYVFPELRP